MGSQGKELAEAAPVTPSSPHPQPWTPSARRCRASRPRLMVSMPPSRASRMPPRRLPPGQSRLTATSGTTAKVQALEISFDETNDKLTKATESLEEAEKQFKEVEGDVSALTKRIMLMEEEDKKSADTLCNTITKLALTSKAADNVLKAVKVVESTCMNNEVTIEELDKNLRATIKMAHDNEQKLVEKIYSLQQKYKVTEARFEYGEMNITKLNQRIDDIEDEIYREKLKIKKCSDELDDTFDDMIANY